jgi:hypothetical protein
MRSRIERVCKCKRSRCLKRYCECYQNDQQCSHKCTCSDCGNGYTPDDAQAINDTHAGSDDAADSPSPTRSPEAPLQSLPAPIQVTASSVRVLKASPDGTIRHDRPPLPHGEHLEPPSEPALLHDCIPRSLSSPLLRLRYRVSSVPTCGFVHIKSACHSRKTPSVDASAPTELPRQLQLLAAEAYARQRAAEAGEAGGPS